MNNIEYGFSNSPFGLIVVARTTTGICDMQFVGNDQRQIMEELTRKWGNGVSISQNDNMARDVAEAAFGGKAHALTLDPKGTDFQKRVWAEVCRIPPGQTASYQEVADRLGNHRGVRAVASAVAKNPVAMLIPCHRVVHSDGSTGQYHWGPELKKNIIAWEADEAKRRL